MFLILFQDDDNIEQPSIHPAAKKLIGKRPAPSSELENFMKSNASQWRREHKNERLKSYHRKNKKIKNNSIVQGSSSNNTNNLDSLKPCYVPPNIPGNPRENSTLRGNAKKMHMRYILFPISCVSCTCFCLFLMIFLLDLQY